MADHAQSPSTENPPKMTRGDKSPTKSHKGKRPTTTSQFAPTPQKLEVSTTDSLKETTEGQPPTPQSAGRTGGLAFSPRQHRSPGSHTMRPRKPSTSVLRLSLLKVVVAAWKRFADARARLQLFTTHQHLISKHQVLSSEHASIQAMVDVLQAKSEDREKSLARANSEASSLITQRKHLRKTLFKTFSSKVANKKLGAIFSAFKSSTMVRPRKRAALLTAASDAIHSEKRRTVLSEHFHGWLRHGLSDCLESSRAHVARLSGGVVASLRHRRQTRLLASTFGEWKVMMAQSRTEYLGEGLEEMRADLTHVRQESEDSIHELMRRVRELEGQRCELEDFLRAAAARRRQLKTSLVEEFVKRKRHARISATMRAWSSECTARRIRRVTSDLEKVAQDSMADRYDQVGLLENRCQDLEVELRNHTLKTKALRRNIVFSNKGHRERNLMRMCLSGWRHRLIFLKNASVAMQTTDSVLYGYSKLWHFRSKARALYKWGQVVRGMKTDAGVQTEVSFPLQVIAHKISSALERNLTTVSTLRGAFRAWMNTLYSVAESEVKKMLEHERVSALGDRDRLRKTLEDECDEIEDGTSHNRLKFVHLWNHHASFVLRNAKTLGARRALWKWGRETDLMAVADNLKTRMNKQLYNEVDAVKTEREKAVERMKKIYLDEFSGLEAKLSTFQTEEQRLRERLVQQSIRSVDTRSINQVFSAWSKVVVATRRERDEQRLMMVMEEKEKQLDHARQEIEETVQLMEMHAEVSQRERDDEWRYKLEGAVSEAVEMQLRLIGSFASRFQQIRMSAFLRRWLNFSIYLRHNHDIETTIVKFKSSTEEALSYAGDIIESMRVQERERFDSHMARVAEERERSRKELLRRVIMLFTTRHRAGCLKVWAQFVESQKREELERTLDEEREVSTRAIEELKSETANEISRLQTNQTLLVASVLRNLSHRARNTFSSIGFYRLREWGELTKQRTHYSARIASEREETRRVVEGLTETILEAETTGADVRLHLIKRLCHSLDSKHVGAYYGQWVKEHRRARMAESDAARRLAEEERYQALVHSKVTEAETDSAREMDREQFEELARSLHHQNVSLKRESVLRSLLAAHRHHLRSNLATWRSFAHTTTIVKVHSLLRDTGKAGLRSLLRAVLTKLTQGSLHAALWHWSAVSREIRHESDMFAFQEVSGRTLERERAASVAVENTAMEMAREERERFSERLKTAETAKASLELQLAAHVFGKYDGWGLGLAMHKWRQFTHSESERERRDALVAVKDKEMAVMHDSHQADKSHLRSHSLSRALTMLMDRGGMHSYLSKWKSFALKSTSHSHIADLRRQLSDQLDSTRTVTSERESLRAVMCVRMLTSVSHTHRLLRMGSALRLLLQRPLEESVARQRVEADMEISRVKVETDSSLRKLHSTMSEEMSKAWEERMEKEGELEHERELGQLTHQGFMDHLRGMQSNHNSQVHKLCAVWAKGLDRSLMAVNVHLWTKAVAALRDQEVKGELREVQVQAETSQLRAENTLRSLKQQSIGAVTRHLGLIRLQKCFHYWQSWAQTEASADTLREVRSKSTWDLHETVTSVLTEAEDKLAVIEEESHLHHSNMSEEFQAHLVRERQLNLRLHNTLLHRSLLSWHLSHLRHLFRQWVHFSFVERRVLEVTALEEQKSNLEELFVQEQSRANHELHTLKETKEQELATARQEKEQEVAELNSRRQREKTLFEEREFSLMSFSDQLKRRLLLGAMVEGHLRSLRAAFNKLRTFQFQQTISNLEQVMGEKDVSVESHHRTKLKLLFRLIEVSMNRLKSHHLRRWQLKAQTITFKGMLGRVQAELSRIELKTASVEEGILKVTAAMHEDMELKVEAKERQVKTLKSEKRNMGRTVARRQTIHRNTHGLAKVFLTWRHNATHQRKEREKECALHLHEADANAAVASLQTELERTREELYHTQLNYEDHLWRLEGELRNVRNEHMFNFFLSLHHRILRTHWRQWSTVVADDRFGAHLVSVQEQADAAIAVANRHAQDDYEMRVEEVSEVNHRLEIINMEATRRVWRAEMRKLLVGAIVRVRDWVFWSQSGSFRHWKRRVAEMREEEQLQMEKEHVSLRLRLRQSERSVEEVRAWSLSNLLDAMEKRVVRRAFDKMKVHAHHDSVLSKVETLKANSEVALAETSRMFETKLEEVRRYNEAMVEKDRESFYAILSELEQAHVSAQDTQLADFEDHKEKLDSEVWRLKRRLLLSFVMRLERGVRRGRLSSWQRHTRLLTANLIEGEHRYNMEEAEERCEREKKVLLEEKARSEESWRSRCEELKNKVAEETSSHAHSRQRMLYHVLNSWQNVEVARAFHTWTRFGLGTLVSEIRGEMEERSEEFQHVLQRLEEQRKVQTELAARRFESEVSGLEDVFRGDMEGVQRHMGMVEGDRRRLQMVIMRQLLEGLRRNAIGRGFFRWRSYAKGDAYAGAMADMTLKVAEQLAHHRRSSLAKLLQILLSGFAKHVAMRIGNAWTTWREVTLDGRRRSTLSALLSYLSHSHSNKAHRTRLRNALFTWAKYANEGRMEEQGLRHRTLQQSFAVVKSQRDAFRANLCTRSLLRLHHSHYRRALQHWRVYLRAEGQDEVESAFAHLTSLSRHDRQVMDDYQRMVEKEREGLDRQLGALQGSLSNALKSRLSSLLGRIDRSYRREYLLMWRSFSVTSHRVGARKLLATLASKHISLAHSNLVSLRCREVWRKWMRVADLSREEQKVTEALIRQAEADGLVQSDLLKKFYRNKEAVDKKHEAERQLWEKKMSVASHQASHRSLLLLSKYLRSAIDFKRAGLAVSTWRAVVFGQQVRLHSSLRRFCALHNYQTLRVTIERWRSDAHAHNRLERLAHTDKSEYFEQRRDVLRLHLSGWSNVVWRRRKWDMQRHLSELQRLKDDALAAADKRKHLMESSVRELVQEHYETAGGMEVDLQKALSDKVNLSMQLEDTSKVLDETVGDKRRLEEQLATCTQRLESEVAYRRSVLETWEREKLIFVRRVLTGLQKSVLNSYFIAFHRKTSLVSISNLRQSAAAGVSGLLRAWHNRVIWSNHWSKWRRFTESERWRKCVRDREKLVTWRTFVMKSMLDGERQESAQVPSLLESLQVVQSANSKLEDMLAQARREIDWLRQRENGAQIAVSTLQQVHLQQDTSRRQVCVRFMASRLRECERSVKQRVLQRLHHYSTTSNCQHLLDSAREELQLAVTEVENVTNNFDTSRRRFARARAALLNAAVAGVFWRWMGTKFGTWRAFVSHSAWSGRYAQLYSQSHSTGEALEIVRGSAKMTSELSMNLQRELKDCVRRRLLIILRSMDNVKMQKMYFTWKNATITVTLSTIHAAAQRLQLQYRRLGEEKDWDTTELWWRSQSFLFRWLSAATKPLLRRALGNALAKWVLHTRSSAAVEKINESYSAKAAVSDRLRSEAAFKYSQLLRFVFVRLSNAQLLRRTHAQIVTSLHKWRLWATETALCESSRDALTQLRAVEDRETMAIGAVREMRDLQSHLHTMEKEKRRDRIRAGARALRRVHQMVHQNRFRQWARFSWSQLQAASVSQRSTIKSFRRIYLRGFFHKLRLRVLSFYTTTWREFSSRSSFELRALNTVKEAILAQEEASARYEEARGELELARASEELVKRNMDENLDMLGRERRHLGRKMAQRLLALIHFRGAFQALWIWRRYVALSAVARDKNQMIAKTQDETLRAYSFLRRVLCGQMAKLFGRICRDRQRMCLLVWQGNSRVAAIHAANSLLIDDLSSQIRLDRETAGDQMVVQLEEKHLLESENNKMSEILRATLQQLKRYSLTTVRHTLGSIDKSAITRSFYHWLNESRIITVANAANEAVVDKDKKLKEAVQITERVRQEYGQVDTVFNAQERFWHYKYNAIRVKLTTMLLVRVRQAAQVAATMRWRDYCWGQRYLMASKEMEEAAQLMVLERREKDLLMQDFDSLQVATVSEKYLDGAVMIARSTRNLNKRVFTRAFWVWFRFSVAVLDEMRVEEIEHRVTEKKAMALEDHLVISEQTRVIAEKEDLLRKAMSAMAEADMESQFTRRRAMTMFIVKCQRQVAGSWFGVWRWGARASIVRQFLERCEQYQQELSTCTRNVEVLNEQLHEVALVRDQEASIGSVQLTSTKIGLLSSVCRHLHFRLSSWALTKWRYNHHLIKITEGFKDALAGLKSTVAELSSEHKETSDKLRLQSHQMEEDARKWGEERSELKTLGTKLRSGLILKTMIHARHMSTLKWWYRWKTTMGYQAIYNKYSTALNETASHLFSSQSQVGNQNSQLQQLKLKTDAQITALVATKRALFHKLVTHLLRFGERRTHLNFFRKWRGYTSSSRQEMWITSRLEGQLKEKDRVNEESRRQVVQAVAITLWRASVRFVTASLRANLARWRHCCESDAMAHSFENELVKVQNALVNSRGQFDMALSKVRSQMWRASTLLLHQVEKRTELILRARALRIWRSQCVEMDTAKKLGDLAHSSKALLSQIESEARSAEEVAVDKMVALEEREHAAKQELKLIIRRTSKSRDGLFHFHLMRWSKQMHRLSIGLWLGKWRGACTGSLVLSEEALASEVERQRHARRVCGGVTLARALARCVDERAVRSCVVIWRKHSVLSHWTGEVRQQADIAQQERKDKTHSQQLLRQTRVAAVLAAVKASNRSIFRRFMSTWTVQSKLSTATQRFSSVLAKEEEHRNGVEKEAERANDSITALSSQLDQTSSEYAEFADLMIRSHDVRLGRLEEAFGRRVDTSLTNRCFSAWRGWSSKSRWEKVVGEVAVQRNAAEERVGVLEAAMEDMKRHRREEQYRVQQHVSSVGRDSQRMCSRYVVRTIVAFNRRAVHKRFNSWRAFVSNLRLQSFYDKMLQEKESVIDSTASSKEQVMVMLRAVEGRSQQELATLRGDVSRSTLLYYRLLSRWWRHLVLRRALASMERNRIASRASSATSAHVNELSSHMQGRQRKLALQFLHKTFANMRRAVLKTAMDKWERQGEVAAVKSQCDAKLSECEKEIEALRQDSDLLFEATQIERLTQATTTLRHMCVRTDRVRLARAFFRLHSFSHSQGYRGQLQERDEWLTQSRADIQHLQALARSSKQQADSQAEETVAQGHRFTGHVTKVERELGHLRLLVLRSALFRLQALTGTRGLLHFRLGCATVGFREHLESRRREWEDELDRLRTETGGRLALAMVHTVNSVVRATLNGVVWRFLTHWRVSASTETAVLHLEEHNTREMQVVVSEMSALKRCAFEAEEAARAERARTDEHVSKLSSMLESYRTSYLKMYCSKVDGLAMAASLCVWRHSLSSGEVCQWKMEWERESLARVDCERHHSVLLERLNEAEAVARRRDAEIRQARGHHRAKLLKHIDSVIGGRAVIHALWHWKQLCSIDALHETFTNTIARGQTELRRVMSEADSVRERAMVMEERGRAESHSLSTQVDMLNRDKNKLLLSLVSKSLVHIIHRRPMTFALQQWRRVVGETSMENKYAVVLRQREEALQQAHTSNSTSSHQVKMMEAETNQLRTRVGRERRARAATILASLGKMWHALAAAMRFHWWMQQVALARCESRLRSQQDNLRAEVGKQGGIERTYIKRRSMVGLIRLLHRSLRQVGLHRAVASWSTSTSYMRLLETARRQRDKNLRNTEEILSRMELLAEQVGKSRQRAAATALWLIWKRKWTTDKSRAMMRMRTHADRQTAVAATMMVGREAGEREKTVAEARERQKAASELEAVTQQFLDDRQRMHTQFNAKSAELMGVMDLLRRRILVKCAFNLDRRFIAHAFYRLSLHAATHRTMEIGHVTVDRAVAEVEGRRHLERRREVGVLRPQASRVVVWRLMALASLWKRHWFDRWYRGHVAIMREGMTSARYALEQTGRIGRELAQETAREWMQRLKILAVRRLHRIVQAQVLLHVAHGFGRWTTWMAVVATQEAMMVMVNRYKAAEARYLDEINRSQETIESLRRGVDVGVGGGYVTPPKGVVGRDFSSSPPRGRYVSPVRTEQEVRLVQELRNRHQSPEFSRGRGGGYEDYTTATGSRVHRTPHPHHSHSPVNAGGPVRSESRFARAVLGARVLMSLERKNVQRYMRRWRKYSRHQSKNKSPKTSILRKSRR